MKKLTKIQSAILGVITGSLLTTAVWCGVEAITPSEEFVNAKVQVAEAYGMSVNDIKLYRHDIDDPIWEQVMDCSQFSSENELYPNFVYSAELNGEKTIIAAVVVSPNKEKFNNMTMFSPIKSIEYCYDATGRMEPVHVAVIDLTAEGVDIDVDTVIDSIDNEL